MAKVTLLLLTLVYFISSAFCDNLVVNTASGPIEGIEIKTALGQKVHAYLGIPYAEPPLGSARFKAPVPIKPWTETLSAKSRSKSCYQAVGPHGRIKGFEWWIAADDDVSEDCLTLNIWVPEPAPKDAAVMVWIHGGAFEGGTSTSDKYDGQLLASQGDVIVVSVNYRLNAFGFLYLDHEDVPGNAGLKDQALALKWIQENIKAFGGDKQRVTIFGQSAGAASVAHHMSIPSSQGLFKRVIVQSGSSNANWGFSDKFASSKLGESIAHAVGCSKNAKKREDIIECLRKTDVKTLIKKSIDAKPTGSSSIKFTPVVDGDYITDRADVAFSSQKVDSDIDVMIGATSGEGSMFLAMLKIIEPKENSFISSKTFSIVIKTLLKTDDPNVANLVQHFYTDWENPEDPVKIREQANHLATDLMFLCSINALNDLLANNGNKVYRYQFTHHPSVIPIPSWLGSLHGDEIDFIFGWPLDKSKSYTEEEAQLAKRVIKYWTNFAKYGDPNGKSKDDNLVWPKYSTESRSHVTLGLETKVSKGRDLRVQQCALWDKLLPQVIASAHSAKSQCGKVA